MSEYLIPSKENIIALYNEVIPLLQELKTKEDIIKFSEKHKVTMEINYDLAVNYDENQPIEVIRCESWGDLDYIYVYADGSAPRFDVWCDFMECDFIEGTTIENFEEDYDKGIGWICCNMIGSERAEEFAGILEKFGYKVTR